MHSFWENKGVWREGIIYSRSTGNTPTVSEFCCSCCVSFCLLQITELQIGMFLRESGEWENVLFYYNPVGEFCQGDHAIEPIWIMWIDMIILEYFGITTLNSDDFLVCREPSWYHRGTVSPQLHLLISDFFLHDNRHFSMKENKKYHIFYCWFPSTSQYFFVCLSSAVSDALGLSFHPVQNSLLRPYAYFMHHGPHIQVH